jgi:hypothetical protein
MKSRICLSLTALLLVMVAAGAIYLRSLQTGADMTRAAQAYLATLTDEQKAVGLMDFDTPQRVGWHFIPMDQRKGLQVKDMNDAQRQAAFTLLEAALSEAGYGKARTIMALEGILHELEKTRSSGPIRDPQRYYYTVFGQPAETGRWGLSIEGHHLSLNFVVDDNQVIASSPTFFAANPSVVKDEFPGMPAKGTRVLDQEEEIAFALLRSLEPAQRARAIIAERAPRDIRAAGEAEAPKYETTGLAYSQMNADQQAMLTRLIRVYAGNLPEDVCAQRLAAIEKAGYDACTSRGLAPIDPASDTTILSKGRRFRSNSSTSNPTRPATRPATFTAFGATLKATSRFPSSAEADHPRKLCWPTSLSQQQLFVPPMTGQSTFEPAIVVLDVVPRGTWSN